MSTPNVNGSIPEVSLPAVAGDIDKAGDPTRTDIQSQTNPNIVERNRRNARKSTGPKTRAGKKWSSRNAVKEGFFAKFLLVNHRDGGEDPLEFKELLADLCEHFRPVGFMEEIRVQRIAMLLWRHRRVIRCEAGLISQALAERALDMQLPCLGVDHVFLPSDSDRLLRYEALISRRLEQEFADLERIQERRTRKSLWECRRGATTE